MQYIVEENLSNFKFWSGGKDRADMFTASQLDEIGERLDEIFGDKIPTDTEINDLFWFDVETVASLIGIELDEDEEIIEDKEEWAGEIIYKYNQTLYEIYFDDFWYDARIPREPDWTTKQEVIEAFDEYVDDNWLDHAHDVLDEKFPDADEGAKDDFADEHWQNAQSDNLNLIAFEKFLEEYLKDDEE